MSETVIGIRVRAWDSQSIRVLAGFRQTVAARRLPWRWQVSTKRKKRAGLTDVSADAWILGPGVRPPHGLRPNVPLVSADEFDLHASESCWMAAHLDQAAVGRVAAEHLRQCGYGAFAVVVPQEASALRERALACIAALHGKRLTVDIIEWTDPAGAPLTALRQHLLKLTTKPCGVFAPDDQLAARLRQVALAAAIPLPDRLGILGAGDLSSACLATSPELSSVAVPWHAFGSVAVGQLQHLLAGKSAHRPHLIRPFAVEARASTLFCGHGDTLVRRACALIRKHLQQQWPVKEIATRLGVSEATLNRRLHRATGTTPYAWRNQRRLELAQQLLADPLLSLVQVQRRCGFGSMRSFHRLLHDHCGMGPEAYRKHLFIGGSAATL